MNVAEIKSVEQVTPLLGFLRECFDAVSTRSKAPEKLKKFDAFLKLVFATACDRSGKGLLLVSLGEDSTPNGLLLAHDVSNHFVGRRAVISLAYMRPGAQTPGRIVMDRVLSWARSRCLDVVTCTSVHLSKFGQRLYRRYGFRPVAVELMLPL